MTLDELREMVFERIGVHDSQEILSDNDVIRQWIQAVKYWSRYMDATSLTDPSGSTAGPRQIGFEVDESLEYTFTGPIPSKIKVLFSMPLGQAVPCWMYSYTKPIITLYKRAGGRPGRYVALYDGSLSYEELTPDEVPYHLLDLFAAYVKRAVGQFLKFSGYQDKPFDVDGVQWYEEGSKWADKLENFIMVNRDERMSNIATFN